MKLAPCKHTPHHNKRLPMSRKWRCFRRWFEFNEWHEQGYCHWYFPRWLKRPFAVYWLSWSFLRYVKPWEGEAGRQ